MTWASTGLAAGAQSVRFTHSARSRGRWATQPKSAQKLARGPILPRIQTFEISVFLQKAVLI